MMDWWLFNILLFNTSLYQSAVELFFSNSKNKKTKTKKNILCNYMHIQSRCRWRMFAIYKRCSESRQFETLPRAGHRQSFFHNASDVGHHSAGRLVRRMSLDQNRTVWANAIGSHGLWRSRTRRSPTDHFGNAPGKVHWMEIKRLNERSKMYSTRIYTGTSRSWRWASKVNRRETILPTGTDPLGAESRPPANWPAPGPRSRPALQRIRVESVERILSSSGDQAPPAGSLAISVGGSFRRQSSRLLRTLFAERHQSESGKSMRRTSSSAVRGRTAAPAVNADDHRRLDVGSGALGRFRRPPNALATSGGHSFLLQWRRGRRRRQQQQRIHYPVVGVPSLVIFFSLSCTTTDSFIDFYYRILCIHILS